MRIQTFFICLILQLLFHNLSYAAKKLNVTGDYTHQTATMVFPATVGNYERKSIYAFDKERNNISGSYQLSNNNTVITVYVYPGGAADNNRFRRMYLAGLQSIRMAENLLVAETTQNYVSFHKDGYKVNGYEGYININNQKHTAMRLYECGEWFLKIRITSDNRDTAQLSKLFTEFTETFNPVILVKNAPLTSKSNIHVTPAALRDSSFLYCVFASALAKVKWAIDNVDSLERLSGFPSLYPDMYVASMTAFAYDIDKKPEFKLSDYTRKYIKEIKSLINAGYLDEYIMEEHSYIMYTAPGTVFDYDGYHKWQQSHKIDYTLTGEVYDIIIYPPLKTRLDSE